MSIQKFVAVVVAVCASALIVPVAAGAQTLPSGTSTASLAHVPVSGVAKNHKTFNGHFAVGPVRRPRREDIRGRHPDRKARQQAHRSLGRRDPGERRHAVPRRRRLSRGGDMSGAPPRTRPSQPQPAGPRRDARRRVAGESADCPGHHGSTRSGQSARKLGVRRVESAQRHGRNNAIDSGRDGWLAQPRQHPVERPSAKQLVALERAWRERNAVWQVVPLAPQSSCSATGRGGTGHVASTKAYTYRISKAGPQFLTRKCREHLRLCSAGARSAWGAGPLARARALRPIDRGERLQAENRPRPRPRKLGVGHTGELAEFTTRRLLCCSISDTHRRC